jgi:mRNA interferase MazF
VVSPDEINDIVRTIVVVPLTSTRERYGFRVPSNFQGREGDLAIDHIRSVDRRRLIRRLGPLDSHTSRLLADELVEMFQF